MLIYLYIIVEYKGLLSVIAQLQCPIALWDALSLLVPVKTTHSLYKLLLFVNYFLD